MIFNTAPTGTENEEQRKKTKSKQVRAADALPELTGLRGVATPEIILVRSKSHGSRARPIFKIKWAALDLTPRDCAHPAPSRPSMTFGTLLSRA